MKGFIGVTRAVLALGLLLVLYLLARLSNGVLSLMIWVAGE